MAATNTLKSSGTQAATVGTEHYLLSTSDNGTYILIVNAENMVSGDTTELRLYLSTTDGAQPDVCYYGKLQGAQGSDARVYISVPLPSYSGCSFTLKQTAGTSRTYQWQVLAL